MADIPASDDLDTIRDELLRERLTHRTFTLWSTEWAADYTSSGSIDTGTLGDPVEVLFRGTHYHRWYAAARAQMPRILAVCTQDPSAVALSEQIEAEIDVLGARTWLFCLPSGSVVACLELSFHDRHSATARPIPQIFDVVDVGRSELVIGGQPLLDACSRRRHQFLESLCLGGDMHHIWCLGDGAISRSLTLDKELLMQMVSRRAESSRGEMLSASFPLEPNRFADQAAAVTPGASVLAGQSRPVELSMVMCAVQALGSLSFLRQTQRDAFSALASLRNPASNSLTQLVVQTQRLKALEVDLSFGVEAYLEQRLLVPSLPVEQLHSALVDSLALPQGAQITAKMLQRLTGALEAEAGVLSVEAADREEHRRRLRAIALARAERRASARRVAAASAAGVAGLVALPLTFLGANIKEVDDQRSLFHLNYVPYYAIILAIVVATAISASLYLARSDRQVEAEAEAAEASYASAREADVAPEGATSARVS
jgi:hypothetical protein